MAEESKYHKKVARVHVPLRQQRPQTKVLSPASIGRTGEKVYTYGTEKLPNRAQDSGETVDVDDGLGVFSTLLSRGKASAAALEAQRKSVCYEDRLW